MTIAYFTAEDPRNLHRIDQAVDALLADLRITRTNTLLADTAPTGPLRSDLGVIEPAAPVRRDAVIRALTNAPSGRAADYQRLCWQVRAGVSISSGLIATVGGWLTTKTHRDAVIALLVGTGLETAIQVADGDRPAAERVMSHLFTAGRAHRPGPHLAEHVEALTYLVAHLPPTHQVSPRTLLALIAWWQGNGALADRHLEHAMAIDPSYRLARLIQQAVSNAIPPDWARACS